jgi:hypothetical protein
MDERINNTILNIVEILRDHLIGYVKHKELCNIQIDDWAESPSVWINSKSELIFIVVHRLDFTRGRQFIHIDRLGIVYYILNPQTSEYDKLHTLEWVDPDLISKTENLICYLNDIH